MDPILAIFVGQMGPIAANGLQHADADPFGAAVPYLGAGVEGRPVPVWSGGTAGLFCALSARMGGASEIMVVDSSPFRQKIARRMGFIAIGEDEAVRHAKAAWHHEVGGRGANYVSQTRARFDSLNHYLQVLRPQGAVVDLAFYQGGMDGTRLGEKFHHNGLAIRCAQINRMPRQMAHAWNQRRLAQETLRLLQAEGVLIRRHMITHVVPCNDVPDFLRGLLAERPDFLQIVFQA